MATPWTVTHQVPLSMGFSRQENWRGLSFPSPGGLPDPGIEPEFPVSPALACGLFTSREVQPHDYTALISMHCRQILYCLSHQGSPFHLEWFSTTPLGATKQTNFLPDCPHSYCTSPGCNTFSSPLVLSCWLSKEYLEYLFSISPNPSFSFSLKLMPNQVPICPSSAHDYVWSVPRNVLHCKNSSFSSC